MNVRLPLIPTPYIMLIKIHFLKQNVCICAFIFCNILINKMIVIAIRNPYTCKWIAQHYGTSHTKCLIHNKNLYQNDCDISKYINFCTSTWSDHKNILRVYVVSLWMCPVSSWQPVMLQRFAPPVQPTAVRTCSKTKPKRICVYSPLNVVRLPISCTKLM